MPKINGNQITPGTVVEHDGGLWVAVRTNAVKPGKGGAFNQVEPKNLIDARKLNERFHAGETVETIDLELKDFSFLHGRGDMLIFMDLETYGQVELTTDWRSGCFSSRRHEGHFANARQPPGRHRASPYVTLQIVEADSAARGQAAASSCKPAVRENGLRVLVPPFVGGGEGIVAATGEVTYMRLYAAGGLDGQVTAIP